MSIMTLNSTLNQRKFKPSGIIIDDSTNRRDFCIMISPVANTQLIQTSTNATTSPSAVADEFGTLPPFLLLNFVVG